MRGNLAIDKYFHDTSKPVREVIHLEAAFFDRLSDVSEIIILGHSFGEVDMPYFDELAKRTGDEVNWSASIHGKADLAAVDSASSLIFSDPNLIGIFELSDLLLSPSQRSCLF